MFGVSILKERGRTKGFVRKLTTKLSNEFKGYRHGFERLNENGMMNSSKRHNRNVSKSDWKLVQELMD